MPCYHHLNISERESILSLRAQNFSIRQIAKELGRSASTISRELKRNRAKDAPYRYSPSIAQKRYNRRRKLCCRKHSMSKPEVCELVMSLLRRYWSPEQISNRLKIEKNPIQISTSTIYRSWKQYLPVKEYRKYFRTKPYHKPRKGRRTGKLQIPHKIRERPDEANKRTCIGHWESDTLQGKRGSGKLATHTDRYSRKEVAILLRKNGSDAYMAATVNAMKKLTTKTFTTDHGKEFAHHNILTDELGAEVYFADPMSPWQRGTNENTNGLLRQYFPKRTSFAHLTQDDVDIVVDMLNHRPRKCLGWRCPDEIFFDCVLHLT